MYIDEAIERVIRQLDSVMIPASECEKMTDARNALRNVANIVRENRARQAQRAQADAAGEEQNHED